MGKNVTIIHCSIDQFIYLASRSNIASDADIYRESALEWTAWTKPNTYKVSEEIELLLVIEWREMRT